VSHIRESYDLSSTSYTRLMDTQSKTVGEILSLRNKQAGQLMGYRHNTGQNKTIANATSDTLTRTHALVASVCAAAAAGGHDWKRRRGYDES